VAEHHGAHRLENQHAEQHAGRGRRIADLDQAARRFRAQPAGKRLLGAPDRLVIKRLRDLRKLIALAEDHALQGDDVAVENKLGADDQRLR